MAVTMDVVPINGGANGWENTQVIDGLETAFYNMGMNGADSNANTGVPCCVTAPGTTNPYTNDEWGTWSHPDRNTIWSYGGGIRDNRPSPITRITRRFQIVPNGTTSLYVMEFWRPSSVNTTDNTVTITADTTDSNNAHKRNDLIENGDKLRWAPGESDAANADNIGGLTPDTDYYIGDRTETNRLINWNQGTTFKVYSTEAEALAAVAGTEISLTSNPGQTAGKWAFQRPQDAESENKTIDAYQGTTIIFYDSTDVEFIDGQMASGGYSADAVINTDNQSTLSGVFDYREFPVLNGSDRSWFLKGWEQTEDEVFDPTAPTHVGYQGIHSYGYAHTTNAGQKGVINLLPSANVNSRFAPYWKHTIPASGGRSELKIRVWRRPEQDSYQYVRCVAGITIHSVGNGWGAAETYTIPGEEIGGLATTNDYAIGTSTSQTGSTGGSDTNVGGDGVAEIRTTTIGQGTTAYQKSSHGKFIVVKVINDATKAFGTTYWAFALSNNNTLIEIKSGIHWQWLNRMGTNYDGDTESHFGRFTGDLGMDVQSSYAWMNITDRTQQETGYPHFYFATTSTPKQYPIEIRTYRAQGPAQDDNFGVIQFVQEINAVVYPYFTFFLNRGPNWGTNVCDYDYLWNGSFTYIYGSTREIDFYYRQASYQYYGGAQDEPSDTNSLAREMSYGWLRDNDDSSGQLVLKTKYDCNIDTNNADTDNVIYFRDNNHDRTYQSSWNARKKSANYIVKVDDAANYYRPIKGLPVCGKIMPVPYYIPDDFAIIQFAVSPGQTEFRPGDTVEVSASEIYTVIRAAYETQQTGLNGTQYDQSIGTLFVARST